MTTLGLRGGTRAAASAIRSGRLVLAPADYHYAIVTDAFSQSGLQRLRELREVPEGSAVPVFIDRRTTLHALWGRVPQDAEVLARTLAQPLTLIGKPQLSLAWSAGVSDAVAIPCHCIPWMLQLVATVGPIAATGARIVGEHLPVELTGCDTAGISIRIGRW